RSGSGIKLQRFPSVTSFGVETEAGGWFVAAVGHAILTARITRHSILDPVFVPVHFFQQLSVGFVMALSTDGVGHEIAWRFPAHQIASRNRPSRASQIAMAREKLKVDGRPKKSVAVHPLLHPREFQDSCLARNEKNLRLQTEPFHYCNIASIVILARSHGHVFN